MPAKIAAASRAALLPYMVRNTWGRDGEEKRGGTPRLGRGDGGPGRCSYRVPYTAKVPLGSRHLLPSATPRGRSERSRVYALGRESTLSPHGRPRKLPPPPIDTHAPFPSAPSTTATPAPFCIPFASPPFCILQKPYSRLGEARHRIVAYERRPRGIRWISIPPILPFPVDQGCEIIDTGGVIL